MAGTTTPDGRQAMAELARLTHALRSHARRGRLTELPGLLQRRQELLRQLRDRWPDPAACRALAGIDGETRRLLEAEGRRIELELRRVRDGSQALAAYVLRLADPGGLKEYLR